jgi:CIC family chloride channel protein
VKLLVACGASAGMAAAYNTPLGGALFGLEIFLGGCALELYGPLIFAALAATVISRALVSAHPSYLIPPYRLHSLTELVLSLALGAIVGVVSALFIRAIEGGARLAGLVPSPWHRLLPLLALGLVGVVGVFRPELFGNGYDTVNLAFAGALPLDLLLFLPFAKIVLSALCLDLGVPGGLFTPTLFVGGLLGGAFGELMHRLFPQAVHSNGGYVIIGMGAALAGSTRATLAAALILFELTGSYDVILPLAAACVLSTAVSRRVSAESIYTAPLRRRGVQLPRLTRPAWMQREGVRRLVRMRAPSILPNASLEDLLLAMVQVADGDPLYVVDEEGRLRGSVSLEDIREAVEAPES